MSGKDLLVSARLNLAMAKRHGACFRTDVAEAGTGAKGDERVCEHGCAFDDEHSFARFFGCMQLTARQLVQKEGRGLESSPITNFVSS